MSIGTLNGTLNVVTAAAREDAVLELERVEPRLAFLLLLAASSINI